MIDLIQELKTYGLEVNICDPWADSVEAKEEYDINIDIVQWESLIPFQALVVAVAHHQSCSRSNEELQQLLAENSTIIDVKSIVDRQYFRTNDVGVWRL